MKLNISTEEIGKPVSADVELYLHQRFPATAPHKDAKDKKLFSAVGAKKDGRATPTAGKKLPDELTKKVQRSNFDILAAFKSGTISQLTKKHIAPSQQKASLPQGNAVKAAKRSADTPASANDASSKQKSFRKEKLNEYLRNNFFVKNNYFGLKDAQHAPLPTTTSLAEQRSAQSPQQRSKNESKTSETGAAFLKSALQNRLNKSSSSGETMISEADAGRLRIEDVTFVEKRLHLLATIMEEDLEIYDEIKEYVDVVQEEDFECFYAHLRQAEVRLLVKNSLLLERWTVFFVFFFYFDLSLARLHLALLQQLLRLAHRNVLLYLRMFAFWIGNYHNLEVGVSPQPVHVPQSPQSPAEAARAAEQLRGGDERGPEGDEAEQRDHREHLQAQHAPPRTEDPPRPRCRARTA